MEQILVFATLGLALIMFAWGKVRHDITAIICLLVLVLTGVIPVQDAFHGFAHPAVITVAMILIVSRGLQNSGLIDSLGSWAMNLGTNLPLQIFALCLIVCIASAFMNNVGALAIMMPVAIHIAKKSKQSPSLFLMPIAFASLLGGMTTLIGTPPNIILSSFRTEALGRPFQMFDFAPVGVGVAFVGLLFISLIGWRLLPRRVSQNNLKDRFQIDDYITEVYIAKESRLNGIPISEIKRVSSADIQVLSVIRDQRLIQTPDKDIVCMPGDILVIEADSNELKTFVEKSRVKLVGKEPLREEAIGAEYTANAEAVVMANALIANQTAVDLRMRTRYGVNLLAISRQNTRIRRRLDHVIFQVGDVLLLQGEAKKIDEAIRDMGCLPLADRDLKIGKPKNIALALSIMGLALALIVPGILEVQVAFTIAALLMVLTRIMPMSEIYTSIDWPVIVLLGALLPVGTALETTGGTELIAAQILHTGNLFPAWAMVGIVLIVAMFLSDVINNAATVVVMAPISISVANGMGLSPDPFLMAVGIGASCAFLTPIGHQSNTLVMGPGGYKFTDYWRVGLPLEVLIVLVGVPLILYFWPP